tara:strand:+ start:798 stop:1049 length:252 start_codon:yes stop_codon:yes gene_type:complete
MYEVWAEYGAIGVIVFLFVGQILFLQKTLMARLLDLENEEKTTREIVVKLIDRTNRSDEKREEFWRELSDDLAYLKGRTNGKN